MDSLPTGHRTFGGSIAGAGRFLVPRRCASVFCEGVFRLLPITAALITSAFVHGGARGYDVLGGWIPLGKPRTEVGTVATVGVLSQHFDSLDPKSRRTGE
jgi:hypothetical protein